MNKKEFKTLKQHFKNMPAYELKKFIKLCKDNQIDSKTIDLLSMDSKFSSCEELIEAVYNEYGIIITDIEADIERYKAMEEQMKKEHEQKILEEERKVIENFKKAKPMKDIFSSSFEVPKHLIRTTILGYTNGTIIVGEGGLGKSYLTLTEVRKLLKPEQWVFQNGYTTPLALYKFLYDNKNKLIIFDDTLGLLNDPKSVSLLKGALWEQDDGKRIVSYESTSKVIEDYPSWFYFEGRIIILSNKINLKDANIQALKSRCNYYEINMTINEILAIMKEMIKIPYKDTTLEERKKAYKLIEEKSNPAIKNFNFRMLIKAYKYVKYAGNDDSISKMLIETMMELDEELKFIYQLMKSNMSVEEQVAMYMEKGYGKRATYFRKKQKLIKMIKGDDY